MLWFSNYYFWFYFNLLLREICKMVITWQWCVNILWNHYYNINHGVLIFVDSVVHLNHENFNPTKCNFSIDCCMYYDVVFETMNSRTHALCRNHENWCQRIIILSQYYLGYVHGHSLSTIFNSAINNINLMWICNFLNDKYINL